MTSNSGIRSEEGHDVLEAEFVHRLELLSGKSGGGEVSFLLLQLQRIKSVRR
jgi:hypothetical protein